MKRNIFLFLLAVLAVATRAQGPNGSGTYYQAVDGQKGAALKTALCGVVNPHTQRTYANLWTDFLQTDLRPDGKIWDMYSGITNYTPVTDQNSGNTGSEGKNYNREHSMPNSWFNKEYPMYTDLFHMYPTDSYVNNKRGNEPFGETDDPTYQSAEGFSKMGPARSGLGYSGTVFEPNDEYKGDFARTYFYMVTAYETYTTNGQSKRVSSWNSPMLAQNQYPALTDWAVQLLLRWAEQDPVSQKELDRNEAVYGIQHNRNPFIDYPGLEQYIWGSLKDAAFSYDHYAEPTAIRGIRYEQRADAPVYNLQGQRVTQRPLPRGVYIQQGRKVVVK